VQNRLPPPDLRALLESWEIALKGEHKSPSTLRVYRAGVVAFLAFCDAAGLPAELTKDNVRAWMVSLGDVEPATAILRLAALKRFARWCGEEEGIDTDGVLAVRPPKLDQKAVAGLTDDEVRRLIKACDGNQLRDKRDRALFTLFTETGLRAAEMLSLDVADISLTECTLLVRRGKGGKGRRVRFSASCAAVLDRYARARRASGLGASAAFWLGGTGRRLSYTGLAHALRGRAALADVKGFHLHRLRHTAAVRWLRAGGSETGLMSQSGWKSRKMVDRYVASAAEELASEEFDRLGLEIGPD
jgi:integrase/recombinase XerD